MGGEEAIRLSTEGRPDLVLLDIKMPDVNGFEVLKHIRSQPVLSDVPVIFVTAHANQPMIHKARSLGADGYITKPFQFDTVIETVQEVLGDGEPPSGEA